MCAHSLTPCGMVIRGRGQHPPRKGQGGMQFLRGASISMEASAEEPGKDRKEKRKQEERVKKSERRRGSRKKESCR